MRHLFYAMRLGIFPIVIVLLNTSAGFAQNQVKGKVTESISGRPLVGATVKVQNAAIAAVTDSSGYFLLPNVPSRSLIVITSVGFRSQQIEINGSGNLDIKLLNEVSKLDEVVVVGYGTQKVRDITGAISSISTKQIQEVPVVQVSQALQGRAAGVYVTSESNKPGAGATIRIRGNRSFSASNAPLFVIDGIPNAGGMEDINPNDIVSIDILKDASATAIYGSQGANGVILVTTRRGKAGETTVNYSVYAGFPKAYRKAPVFTGEEYAEYKRESFRAIGTYDDNNPDADKDILTPLEIENLKNGLTTDFQDLLLQTGFKQNHQLSILGGTEKTKFSIAFNYFNEKGIIPIQDYTRYSARINLDQQLGKMFKIGTSTLISHSISNGQSLNPYLPALVESPLVYPYDSVGNPIFRLTNDALRSNPLSELVPGARVNREKRYHVIVGVYGEVQLTEGLKYRLNFGPDFYQTRSANYNGSNTSDRLGASPTANTIEGNTFTYTLENILTYSKELREKHSFNLTALHSVQSRRMENTSINVLGVPVEEMQFYNLAASDQILGVGSALEQWGINSYMGRINYGYDGRYLVTLTGRLDGSSRFGEGHKYGFFPSFAIGWNITNEGFMKNNTVFDNLKLRVSYGVTGNTGVLPYQTQGLLGRTVYAFGETSAFGYRPSQIRNDNLKWESTASANIGLDFSIYHGRLSGSVEFYRQNTTDLLMLRQLPFTSGFGSVLENVGETRNSGFEISLSSVNISSPNSQGFQWTTDLNLSSNKEEIVSLYGGKQDDIGNVWFIGQPISVYYDYEKIGIWQTNEKDAASGMGFFPGEIKVKDQNGDGVINSADRVILGTSRPSLTGGLTNRITFKNFELSAFLFARFGSMIKSSFHSGLSMLMHGRWNNIAVDYWTPYNPTNDYPRPNRNQEGPKNGSTLTYFDGSFVKLRNVTLAYNFQPAVYKKIGAKSLRLYVTAEQPFIWSPYVQKYNGIDPENTEVDTPALTAFTMGLNVSF